MVMCGIANPKMAVQICPEPNKMTSVLTNNKLISNHKSSITETVEVYLLLVCCSTKQNNVFYVVEV